MKSLTKLGIVITAIWIILVCIIVGFKWETALSMELNAWGDFLAGISAPLALLWLVIGYFQQGKELQLNTKALQTQQEELRRQVAETARLAEHSERQAQASEAIASLSREEIEREEQEKKIQAQPVFTPNGGSTSGGIITIKVLNRGGNVRNVSLSCDSPHKVTLSVGRYWDTDGVGQINIRQGQSAPFEWPIKFSISYRDSLNEIDTQRFELVSAHDFQPIPERSASKLAPPDA